MKQPRDGPAPLAPPVPLGAVALIVTLAVVAARAQADDESSTPVQQAGGVLEQGIVGILIGLPAVAALLMIGGSWLRRGKRQQRSARERARMRRALLIGAAVVVADLIAAWLIPALQSGGPADADSAAADQDGSGGAEDDPSGAGSLPNQADLDLWVTVLVLVLVMVMGLAVLGLAIYRDRLASRTEPDPQDGAADGLARSVSAGRAAVLDDTIGDPRSAIIACFAAMEQALSGRDDDISPNEADTPQEVLHRARRTGMLREDGRSWRLLELFREARFSSHPISETNRSEAAGALTEMLDDLGARR